jgi:DNA repair protein RadA/Sms
MNKLKIKYTCTSCGYESLRWIGKCPECESWNSFTEEIIETGKRKPVLKETVPVSALSEITAKEEEREKTNIEEFDRVLGGGLMAGSVVLIGGDPGIGKSTLVLQAAGKIKQKVLYVTGEESLKQIKLRAERLKISSENLFTLSETELNKILSAVNTLNPAVIIIDSIQTIYNSSLDNSPGTITQIRECTAALLDEAKKKNYSVIIIGHITKEGFIAGPKVLEHIVDTVLQFEGDSHHVYRILRAQKNRFGSTNEIGIFEMHREGLLEVKNPSELFLSEREKEAPGSVVTCSIEGTRPILIEVQALVTPSNFGNPQRVTTGFDGRRLSILLAVLEKRGGYRTSALNVFLNMAGGVKIDEPAVDLAVCCAIASSLSDKPVAAKTVITGEVGLGGEVRSIGNIEKRIQEAEKLGFNKIIFPHNNLKNLKIKSGINLTAVKNLSDTIRLLFE